MNYTSITDAQRSQMLETLGARSIDELFEVIPEESRLHGPLDLPAPASELELQRELSRLADANHGADRRTCFLGGGAYDHFIPSFIDQMINRGEFLTAYTPYQPEASQGALQALFEFQTQIARLTGMDQANTSLYEGATAVVEAALLALRATGKRKVVVSAGLHPHAIAALRTYLADLSADLVVVERNAKTGATDPEALAKEAATDAACVIVQSPNFFGVIEDWSACFTRSKSSATGASPIAIAACNPIACALLKTPGACDADIAVGDGQPLGIPLQFGGPYVGLFAAKKKFLRKMPGRLVGEALDEAGRRCYTLVLQTREQHIRRDKATSNICTNQGLLALRATMFLTAMGANGLREMAQQCWHKAHDTAERIADLPGYNLRHTSQFFHEFVVTCPKPAREIVAQCKEQNILAGIALDDPRVNNAGAANDLLVAVTEKRTTTDITALVDALQVAAR